jgi:hypothetical protein
VMSSRFGSNDTALRDLFGGTANGLSVRGTLFEGNVIGMDLYAAIAMVSGSTFTGNEAGLLVGPGSADIRDSEFWGGEAGVVSYPDGILTLSRSHTFGNVFGVIQDGGLVFSFGNNVIRGNGTDTFGTITTIPEQ